MTPPNAIPLFSEIIMIDQSFRSQLARVLPKGMELSHFSVLNHLASASGERTPAQIAKALHVSRGAMTNTLAKLEANGDVHIRGDWEDARRKFVSISEAGKLKRDMALRAAAPLLDETELFSPEEQKQLLSMLRKLREEMFSRD